MKEKSPTSSDAVRVVCISDTHGFHTTLRHPIPEGDILIHSGDFSGRGLLSETLEFADWVSKLPHEHKIVVAGNHDAAAELVPEDVEKIFKDRDINYLNGTSVDVCGLKVYGSPFTPKFYDWHFMLDRGPQAVTEWSKIPDDTDILVTHGPPYGHGDLANGHLPLAVGCVDLLNRLRQLHVKLHVFGHIHGGYGVTASDAIPNLLCVNASICTEAYRPNNRPICVSIASGTAYPTSNV